MTRHIKKEVTIGDVTIGGNHPVAVQTMLSKPADDVMANVAQAQSIEQAGCDILRVSVPTLKNVELIPALKEAVTIPIVADIHFDWRIAAAAAEAGADKIRINPGNIGSNDKIKKVVDSCHTHNVPIRIGINSGSIEKEVYEKHGGATPQAMVESATNNVRLLEQFGFTDIVISLKSSDVAVTMDAFELLNKTCDYPLHLGITEAGTYHLGIVKSAMGIGGLLMQGIGDTIRVSLTDEPEKEIEAGLDILRAAGHEVPGPEVISCPTCGRTKIPVADLALEVERRLAGYSHPIKVAVMGCVVNGPGEAKDADIGIAGGDGRAVLFAGGKQLRVIEENFVDELIKEIDNLEL